MLNHWRMAQLHAQEAPDRVRELEYWGAVFDRTRDGRILQRPFGGHSHPRLAHVGDRTGLEMIRTLQDRTVQSGVTVYMECTTTQLMVDDGRVTGRLRLLAPDGGPRRLRRQGGGAGHRRHRAHLADHLQLLGVLRRRARPGLPGRRRADRHGVRAVPPDRHGLAARRARPAGDRGGARRGRHPAQQGGGALHVALPAGGPAARVRRDR